MGNRAQRRTLRTITAGAVLVGAFLAGGVAVAGASTGDPDPEVYADNPTCEDMGYDFGFKLEPQGIPVEGDYVVPADEEFLPEGATITITRVDTSGRVEFDWTSDVAWSAVMVKQANGGLIYRYDPARDSDEHVQTTLNNSDGISHVNFCGPGEATEPCEFNPELAADDPGCVPPPEVEACAFNPDLEADDPLCVKPTVVPSDPEVLGNTVVQPQPATLPRTGTNTAPLAAVGGGLVLIGAALVEMQRRKVRA